MWAEAIMLYQWQGPEVLLSDVNAFPAQVIVCNPIVVVTKKKPFLFPFLLICGAVKSLSARHVNVNG